jgi:hypothetical protein
MEKPPKTYRHGSFFEEQCPILAAKEKIVANRAISYMIYSVEVG